MMSHSKSSFFFSCSFWYKSTGLVRTHDKYNKNPKCVYDLTQARRRRRIYLYSTITEWVEIRPTPRILSKLLLQPSVHPMVELSDAQRGYKGNLGCVEYNKYLESETRSDSDDGGSDEQPFYGLKLLAADPRHITHGDDDNRRHAPYLGTGARAHNRERTIRGGGSHGLVNHSRNGFLFDRRTKHDSMSQGCKGRESQRPIFSSSNITICYKHSGRSWNWGRSGSASQGRLAGTSEFASTVGQNQEDTGRRQQPSAGLQRCQCVTTIHKNRPTQESPFGNGFYRESGV